MDDLSRRAVLGGAGALALAGCLQPPSVAGPRSPVDWLPVDLRPTEHSIELVTASIPALEAWPETHRRDLDLDAMQTVLEAEEASLETYVTAESPTHRTMAAQGTVPVEPTIGQVAATTDGERATHEGFELYLSESIEVAVTPDTYLHSQVADYVDDGPVPVRALVDAGLGSGERLAESDETWRRGVRVIRSGAFGLLVGAPPEEDIVLLATGLDVDAEDRLVATIEVAFASDDAASTHAEAIERSYAGEGRESSFERDGAWLVGTVVFDGAPN